jgi:hypothetical protein
VRVLTQTELWPHMQVADFVISAGGSYLNPLGSVCNATQSQIGRKSIAAAISDRLGEAPWQRSSTSTVLLSVCNMVG